jgi:hypothetical protein
MINAVGIDDSNIISKAGKAALAKNASDVKDQTSVANVLNPNGPKTRVAVNSFMVIKNTNAIATITPDLTNGKVTEYITLMFDLPKPLAASSYDGRI